MEFLHCYHVAWCVERHWLALNVAGCQAVSAVGAGGYGGYCFAGSDCCKIGDLVLILGYGGKRRCVFVYCWYRIEMRVDVFIY